VRDRKTLVGAASEFVESQNVTHYFTLTYPIRRSWEGRYKAFLQWIDGLEWLQRRPLGWIRADEVCRFSGLGFPEIPEHHHGLLIDTDHLSSRTAESLWRAYGDALVERYEPHGGAIPYCLKHAFSNCGNWDIGGKALRKYSGSSVKAEKTHDKANCGAPRRGGHIYLIASHLPYPSDVGSALVSTYTARLYRPEGLSVTIRWNL